jgi:hypothetical protein
MWEPQILGRWPCWKVTRPSFQHSTVGNQAAHTGAPVEHIFRGCLLTVCRTLGDVLNSLYEYVWRLQSYEIWIYPEDKCSRFLRNVDTFLPNNMTSILKKKLAGSSEMLILMYQTAWLRPSRWRQEVPPKRWPTSSILQAPTVKMEASWNTRNIGT